MSERTVREWDATRRRQLCGCLGDACTHDILCHCLGCQLGLHDDKYDEPSQAPKEATK